MFGRALSILTVVLLCRTTCLGQQPANSEIWGRQILPQPFEKGPFRQINVPAWLEGTCGVGYTLSVQKDNNLVTNPEPGTIAEFDVAAFSDFNRPPRFTTTRYAKPTAAGAVLTTTVLTEAQMAELVEMARTVEVAYCTAKPTYFPGGSCASVWLSTTKPRSLDMEIKVLANGHYVLKQVREFHGR